MKGACFTFTLPSYATQPFGINGRDMLAEILDGVPGVAPLFHYKETVCGLRRPKSGGLPMTRIRSHGNTLRIDALDNEAREIILKHSMQISDGIGARCGAEPAIGINSYEISINPSACPYLYKAHNVVLARGLDACKAFEQMDGAQRVALAHGVLCRGLERQAGTFGLDLPELPASVIEFAHIVPRAKLIVRDGRVHEHGVVATLLFYWEAKISGSWAVGGLTSRGNGRVWYVSKREAQ